MFENEKRAYVFNLDVLFLKSYNSTDAIKLNMKCRKFNQSINGFTIRYMIAELKPEIKMHSKGDIK